MNTFVVCFQEIDRSKFMVAGGKGANLGELSRMKGIRVPEGFCVTTEAYKKVTGSHQELNGLLDALASEERSSIRSISEKIRAIIESIPIPEDITAKIAAFLSQLGEKDAYARSFR